MISHDIKKDLRDTIRRYKEAEAKIIRLTAELEDLRQKDKDREAWKYDAINVLKEWNADLEEELAQAQADADKQFELGWLVAAEWADREDLRDDIGSPAYLEDRKAARDRAASSASSAPEPKCPKCGLPQAECDGERDYDARNPPLV
jgi:DNA repair exonuclease SbcCD ATPase subunit